ncbi:MAG: L-seryl-tRNA(Sec) selenium transferase [FCB group bacterium]|nr:L-seryl-tRNA(Sec) selenium transferase [FCB group bacterium]
MTSKSQQPYSGLRDFPSVEILSGHVAFSSYYDDLTRPVVVQVVRQTVAALKEKFRTGNNTIGETELIKTVVSELDRYRQQVLQPIINGAGIIIHTNLGRSPLSEDMIIKALPAVTGYSNLEYDLSGGRRGKRGLMIERLLATLCGTESGTLVNNNAAALFIILNSLANRKEVIISRGELVQIGGGFKIPDIMAKSGARLVEVGTTNRTSIDDYRQAVTERTRMILKVHRSNFAQVGFVEETPIKELAELCRERNIISVHDLGSGLVVFPDQVDISAEPNIAESVHAGADLTCFSGDKLLGGMQAGLIAGNKELIGRIKKNPLFRTMRCDKLAFAVTAQVLKAYIENRQFEMIPIWRMITTPVTELKIRGEKILSACPGKDMVLTATQAYLGGGSTPAQSIDSLAVSMRSKIKVNILAKRFRSYAPPIIGRVENDDFLLDLRSIPSEQDDIIIEAIKAILE